MRVAVYYRNSDVRVEERPRPVIGDDELLFKVHACGICGSDVMEWYRLKHAPRVLGHEATGEIIEVGKRVTLYRTGQRVFVAHHVPCNTCRYCRAGNHTVCETLHTTNYFPGGFSEFVRVPALNVARGVFVLPENISYDEGTFIEPLACVLRAQRMVGLTKGQSVLILGTGISGFLHLLAAHAVGCHPIIVTDMNEYRLHLARTLGADAAAHAKEDVPAVVRAHNAGTLADRVIIATGALSAFLQALSCVDRAGTIMCFAPTEPGVTVPLPVNDFWRNSITVTHSYGASPSDTDEALRWLQQKRIDVNRIITHRLVLSEVGKGFQLVASGTECVKVIIHPNA